MDAFTTVLSLAAQYLLNRKTIENWLLWIVDDVIYIWLYIARDLRLTAVLYFVFLMFMRRRIFELAAVA
jgi:nicotinamide mononucleotide transporter